MSMDFSSLCFYLHCIVFLKDGIKDIGRKQAHWPTEGCLVAVTYQLSHTGEPNRLFDSISACRLSEANADIDLDLDCGHSLKV